MPETKSSEPNPDEFGSTADESVDAGIADETAAYDQAIERDGRTNPQDNEDVADGVPGNG